MLCKVPHTDIPGRVDGMIKLVYRLSAVLTVCERLPDVFFELSYEIYTRTCHIYFASLHESDTKTYRVLSFFYRNHIMSHLHELGYTLRL